MFYFSWYTSLPPPPGVFQRVWGILDGNSEVRGGSLGSKKKLNGIDTKQTELLLTFMSAFPPHVSQQALVWSLIWTPRQTVQVFLFILT